jgi:TolA-binding protein
MLRQLLYVSTIVLLLKPVSLWAQDKEAENYLLPEMQDRLTNLEDKVQEMRGEMEKLNHNISKLLQSSEKIESKRPASSTKKESKAMVSDEDGPLAKETSPEEDALAQADLNAEKAKEMHLKKTKKKELVDDKIVDTSEDNSSVFPDEEAQSDYEAAMELLAAEKYKEAEVAFKAFIQKYPKNPLIVNAQYWVGETYFLRKKYKEASINFADAYKKYTDLSKSKNVKGKTANTIGFTKAPEALVKLAFSLKGLGQNEDACVALEQLKAKFPHLPSNVKKLAERARKGLTCKKE